MSNPSPFRALYTPVSMIGVACEQILAHPDVDATIKETAEACFALADEAGEVLSKKISDAVVSKMLQHGDSFRMECRNKGLVKKGQADTAGLVLARLMSGNLCTEHYARKIRVHKYPLWAELITKSATLLDMILPQLSEHEEAAYAVAEYMCAVVTPTDKRAAKREARRIAA